MLSPDGAGSYRAGEVTGGYYYVPGGVLPHRRRVKWLDVVIARDAVSEGLRNSAGSIGTVSNITSHGTEIETFLKAPPLTIVASDPTIEDPSAFAMEKHLEDLLVENWDQTELGKFYAVFEEDGEKVGQQYETDAGPIDILAISKDGKRLLIVELKRGRTSDVVVGQTLRYMGYVKGQIAEADQTVEGAIIPSGGEDSKTPPRAPPEGLPSGATNPSKRAGLTGQIVRYLNRTYRLLPTGDAARASRQANRELTFALDHSLGADHLSMGTNSSFAV